MERRCWRLIHLMQLKGTTRKIVWQILKEDPQLQNIYDENKKSLRDNYGLSEEKATMIFQGLHDKKHKKRIYLEAQKYKIVTIFNSLYPLQLRSIPDPPLVLYLHGNESLLKHTPNISVVGTRAPSAQAKLSMRKLLAPLMKKGWCIVSGMAKGIDGYAHEMAIESACPTIAVLGSGFEHIYPKQHRELYQILAKNHLVISEYSPQTSPQKYHFPERNRIISGLTFGTLVIEAKQRSGSLITVDQALEQGREVFAVPGSIISETSEGCNQLIQDGAKLILSGDDIISEWEDSTQKWK